MVILNTEGTAIMSGIGPEHGLPSGLWVSKEPAVGHYSLQHESRLALVQGSARAGAQESSWVLAPQVTLM